MLNPAVVPSRQPSARPVNLGRTADSLETYNAKRRFAETPEPRGAKVARKRGGAGGIYTIQKHAATRLHYDLRLELDGVLKSWAITKGPSMDPAVKRLAVRTEDHPIDYATFEGRIPEGNYGAGTVLLWDEGSWEPIGDAEQGLAKGKLAFHIKGKRLKGRWALVRMRGGKKEKRENWLLIKEVDAAVSRAHPEITEDYQRSVASDRDLDEIEAAPEAVWGKRGARKTAPASRPRKRAPLPKFAPPALATLVEEVPTGDDWLFEMKLDGYRAIAAVSGDKVRIFTRNGRDWTDRFSGIAEALTGLDLDGALLDGEIVAVDAAGKSDFGLLQQAIKGRQVELSYFVFDLLAVAGKDKRGLKLDQRKEMLKKMLAAAPKKGPIFYNDHLRSGGQRMLDSLCDRGFEGIIAKRADSIYPRGRSSSWLKIKCGRAQEFVVIGWSPSTRGRAFSSILLGLYEEGKLRYAGRVGSGFDTEELGDLSARFRKLERKSPPIAGDVPTAIRSTAHWLEPKLVAHVAFAEFTRDGLVRQGRFIALREDKKPREVVPEMPKSTMPKSAGADDNLAGVRLTHPDKVLFAKQGATKRDLALYLHEIAPRMLPFLKDHLVSLVRCPEGRARQCFFQRHAGAGLTDEIQRMEVREKDGGHEEYLYLSSTAGLIAAAQVSALEFHIWGSSVKSLERPDRIVFDLDPDESVAFPAVRRAALRIRDVLSALGLKSYPLLTGGKGIHIVVPIRPQHEWLVVKAFAAALAHRLVTDAPGGFVATMSKAKRKGRIFIDHFRNERGATAICPYSPRAREGAPLAWPVTWANLPRLDSAALVTLGNFRDWLKKSDPWADYDRRQGLKQSALKALKVDF